MSKFIGEYREFTGEKELDSLVDSFEKEPYPNMDKIASYLKNAKTRCVATRIPKDVFTGESIKMEEKVVGDDVYSWPVVLAYYVERYNLRLPKEFEEHILKNM